MPPPRNTRRTPAVWTREELAEAAERSLNNFVDRRLAEPDTRYAAHVAARRKAVARLFRALRPIDPDNPDPAAVRAILGDPDLRVALRYAAGPPISEDDLGVLVTRGTAGLTKGAIDEDPSLAAASLKLICRLADDARFPWLRARRVPRAGELRNAINATASLNAAQSMQTERRMYGREVERRLRDRLLARGFNHLPPPNRGRPDSPKHMPGATGFFGECSLYGRRTDLLIGLTDGRTVAVEAKDSASVLNSVKRVLNDTAAKARFWTTKMGEQVIPVALLSGVFGVDTLIAAQDAGLYLVWAHDMESFVTWLEAQ